MKNNNFALIVVSVITVILAILVGYMQYRIDELTEYNEFKREMITNYESYYNNVETLLDELDDKYDWVDSFDPQEYYLAKEKLDSLYRSEL
jgi:hypothetical protein